MRIVPETNFLRKRKGLTGSCTLLPSVGVLQIATLGYGPIEIASNSLNRYMADPPVNYECFLAFANKIPLQG